MCLGQKKRVNLKFGLFCRVQKFSSEKLGYVTYNSHNHNLFCYGKKSPCHANSYRKFELEYKERIGDMNAC